MSWNQRLRQAAYNAPDGQRLTFNYENVSRKTHKKTTPFDFPDADGTYIQDLGHTGRQYPLTIYFNGDDCDLQADAFEKLLLQKGVGKLEHPVYGTVDVVPFGAIVRRDDLKTAANQAIVQITFWETITLTYPAAQADPAAAVLAAVQKHTQAAAQEFKNTAKLTTAIQKAALKDTHATLLNRAKNTLATIAEFNKKVAKQFNNIYDSVNQSIDTLIADPLTLAFQTIQLVHTPARQLDNIKARLQAYKNLADRITTTTTATSQADTIAANQFHDNNLYASAYLTASVISVVNNQFDTKTQALQAAEQILAQSDALNIWRDANLQTLKTIDTGAAYQKLQQAVSLAAGFLVQISFTLKQERRFLLTRSRTIIDLVAELYNTVDDQLDYFINTNNLTGSEILELPRGREIVYYI